MEALIRLSTLIPLPTDADIEETCLSDAGDYILTSACAAGQTGGCIMGSRPFPGSNRGGCIMGSRPLPSTGGMHHGVSPLPLVLFTLCPAPPAQHRPSF